QCAPPASSSYSPGCTPATAFPVLSTTAGSCMSSNNPSAKTPPDPLRRGEQTPFSLGGIIHTYQKFDPLNFPSPTSPPPDVVSAAFEHLLFYGSMRRLTEEELARAVRLDPTQIKGLGPSLASLMEMLRERKRKILETYETEHVQKEASKQ